MQPKKGNDKLKKDMGKWREYHKIHWHNTAECRCKLEEYFDSESNPEGEEWIIDFKPNAIVATIKFYPSKPEEPEEGERLFHS